jgi:DNA processing protein
VVSGLALGVDAVAQRSVMTVPDGETFAVLGSGVWNVYPPTNRELAECIGGYWGALVCEVQPDAGVNPAALVARNRIITGLSRAVFIIETEADGGAMHAARFAKAQGRAIYTLDLPASGNQQLIAEGAQIIAPPFAQIIL